MLPGKVIVLDAGKTLSKLSLWDENGRLIDQRQRYNRRIQSRGRHSLDTEGIEGWMADVLAQFALQGRIVALVPVGHGAAAAVVRAGHLACPVADYEDPIEPALRSAYEARRDAFGCTGSPSLPDGLNLGVQLYRLQHEQPEVFAGGAQIVPWPQYWAWKLCGIAASEVSSLGCHTDLWLPAQGRPSGLATSQGWADLLAPVHRADEALGTLSAQWAVRTGLSTETRVYCGVHDSNAALHAVRAFPQACAGEVTVISTGTWFIAMRLLGRGATLDPGTLAETRDCLVNVDVAGQPVPSARFMGGREIEQLCGPGGLATAGALAALPAVLRSGSMVLPGSLRGVGPHPHGPGGWIAEPRDPAPRCAAAALYAALMVDTTLELIGARGPLVIEGRFASAEIFVRALAALRPDAEVLVDRDGECGVAFGALRLVDSTLAVPGTLDRVDPLELDMTDYRKRWRGALREGSAV